MTSGSASAPRPPALPRSALPPAGGGPDAAPYRIAIVCLGNICRSPMAEVVLNDRLARSGLGDQVEVTSAGTGGWHVGEPMDSRAAALLTSHGYDPSRHRGHQLAAEELAGYDLLLAMDSGNHADVLAMAESSSEAEETVDRIRMFRDFDPAVDRAPSGAAAGDRDVPDPYYDDNGFRTVLAMVERVVDALVAALPGVLAAAGRTL